jgi:hypothetical protein
VSDETCCGACGFPIHATKESACDWCRQAADRIEALTAKLTKAAELLEEIEVRLKPISGFFFDTFPRREIKAILAEIKGESHE